MMDYNMNRKNMRIKVSAKETRGKAQSAMSSCMATRRTDKLTSGDSANIHSRRGIFGALLSVLMTAIMISSFALGVFADDLKNTVPSEEVPSGTDFYTGSISTGFVPNGYNTSAQYGPGYGPYNVPGVVQSQSTTSATSFASGLPLGTIFIDQSKISASGGIYKKVSDNPAILAGLVDGVNSASQRTQLYDGTLEGAIKLVPNKINRLDGDLYSMTFEDAAILPNGDRADLVITYSNARIVIDQRYAAAPSNEQYLHGAVYLSKGNEFSRGTLDKTDFRRVSYPTAAQNAVNSTAQSYGTTFANSNAPTPAVGITMDATYTIINKNKTPAEGTFVFAISGINLDRDPDVGGSNNVNKPLWYSYNNNFGGEDGTEHSFFSEAMSINGGQVSDNVYIRPNNDLMDNPTSTAGDKGKYFWPNVSKDSTTGQIKFISNAINSPSLGGHDESYSAGFVVLADASQGLKVTGTGHGGGNTTNTMQSGVFVSKQIWYRYTSKTGPHGNIQITSEGNYNKKLTDGGDVLGPGTYVVTEGKTVTYTMTPDTGYKLSTLKLNGINIKFNTEDINRMKKGDSLTATTAAGWDATLKYETDGTYSLVIPYAEHDESVEVTWEPTTADILYYKTWDDKDDKDGMRVGADGTSDWPEVKLQQSIDGGASWTDVTKDAFGGNLTTSQPVPSGKDTTSGSPTSGEYLDGLYDKQNGTTTHPYTWQYLPVYTYDSNGADRVIQYRIVEGDEPGNDPALTGYKNPKYFDGQSFFLSSEELKSIDGWIVYKDSTTGKYYVSKEDGIDKDDAKYDGNDSDYYEVINWKVQNAKATPQPNKANLSAVISSDSKMIGAEQVLRDPNTGKEYVKRSDKYHEVFYNSISDVGLTFDPNQGDPDPSTFVNSTMNGYNTADKAIAYQSVGVKNEHTVSDIYVEVLKQWNDANLYNQNTVVANGNQYDRRNITFTLHGTKPNGDVVDLNPGDPSTPDLSITLDRGETDSKTDRQTAGGFDIVKDTTNGKEYVLINSDYYEVTSEDEDAVTGSYRPKAASVQPDAGNLSPVTGEKANGEQVLVDSTDNKKYVKVTTGTGTSAEEKYHEVVSIDKAAAQGGYAASPASPQPDRSNLTDVYKSTYKIDDNNFGATFYGLQAYKDGQLINYTVTESYNDVDAWSAEGAKLNQASTWTVTGGMLTENGDGSYTMSGLSEIKQNEDLKGYTGKFINTPIVDDEFRQLPVTIKKKDAFTGQPLEGATFTVYTDAFNRDAGSQPTSSFQELDGYTLYKDLSDNKQYVKINGKYHLVTGYKIADKAADPQPSLTNDNRVKNDNYKQINGKDVETDRKGHNYIKEGNKYYEVDSEGNVSATEANPQPTGTLHKIKTQGAVDQVNVVTDANGDATINFNQTGTYYIVESSSPDGYEDESDKTYRFTVDKKLMKVTFEEASSSDDHDTSFWKRLYDLIFGNGTITDREVWNQVNDRSGTLTLKNTPITANIMTRKVWDDASDQDGVRPTDTTNLPEVELQYTTDDITDDSVTPTWKRAQVYDAQTKQLKDVDIKQFTNAGGAIHADPNNAYTWLDLPAYRDGDIVYYRLVETSPLINDGTYKITKNETVASHDSEFTLVNSNLQPRNQIVEIVNEHKPQTLTINAVKRWNDHSDEDETRPTTLKITLWKTVNNVNTELYSLDLDGEEDAQTAAGYYELAPTDNGDTWNAIFKTLPAYENGSPITYYMVETLTERDRLSYVEKYSISYTKTTGEAGDADNENKVVAKDVKRTYEEEKFDNKTVYTAGGKRYVKQDDQYYEILNVTTYTTGPAADPQPEAANLSQTGDRTTDTDQEVLVDSTTGAKYIYNSVDVKYYSVVEHVNEYISDTEASPQPTDPEKVYTDTENTDATISVENTSKNNVTSHKYWIGGANANIRYHLFRTTQTGSAIAMETKKTTAEPIATSDSIGGETVYIHANGKRYVRRADPADADKFVYHEINDTDDSIATTGVPYTDIEIRTWTPYDLDANGKRQYVKKNDRTIVISEDQYNALQTEVDKAQYEVKIKNGWELVDQHLFVSSAFNTSLSLPGDEETHTFENLPAFDDYGHPYTYRILETTSAGNTEDERFEGHYSVNGHTVTNINKKVQSGETDIDVMKDLEGRAWRTEAEGDVFYFYIDPLKQVNENNGTITEFDDSEAVDKAEIPIPSNGEQWGRAVKDNTAIGSTIREVSFSPIIYELSDVDSSTHTSTYYYKVYESRNTEGEPVYHTDNRGITYDGSLNEKTGVWTPKTLIMKVIATADNNGVVTTTHQWAEYKNDGKALEWSSETPAFKNEYSSASDAKLWIEKNISDRAWVPYNNGKGDAYQFTINSISGAPLNMEHTTQDGAYYTMPLVTKSTSGNPQEDLQNYDTSSWAFGITGDPIDGSVLDNNGRAEFVYEVFERPSATSNPDTDRLGLNDYKVENIEYDASKKYVKVTVQDNWDGTLSFDAQYYSDASCLAKYIIPGNQRWIEDKTEIVYLHNNSKLEKTDPYYVGPTDGNYKKTAEQYNDLSEEDKNKYFLSKVQSKRLLSEEEVASIGGMTGEEIAEAGYRPVNVAHFTNIETDDIVVKKEWVDGPAVEDVSLHLVRHLFDLTEEDNLNKKFIDDEEAKYKEETGKDDFWQVISRRYDVPRGDFLNDDGTPKYDSGSTTTSSQTYGDLKDKDGEAITEPDFISGFNADLPRYVWVTETDSTTGTERNVLKRAVYKLVEDDTSDAYEESYRTSKTGEDDVEGSQYYIDGETLIVTNTVKATNTANIAAVKQLLGRNWIETDEFPFELKAIGAGKYYKKGETGGSEGEFKEPDYSAEAVAKVPMPAVYVKTGSDPKEIITQTRYNELTDEEKAEYTKKSTNFATATSDTTTVDPNGGLERLARFDEIVFTINDLVYNGKSKHYQGDFFYTMTEKLPEIVTTGDNQSYPTAYTYTYKTTEGGKTVNKTETVNITDKSIPSTVPNDGTITFIEWNNGITYDMTEHTVHIKVRENRTGTLEVQIGYDEETDGNISTGTQFTPVYTNKYSAETEVAVSVEKHIMGRKWKTSDKFDFIMNPLGGAPFTDADKTEFPEGEGEDDGSDSDVQAAINADKAAHTERGAHIKRMTIDSEAAQGSDPQTMAMPKLLFKYSDLNQIVGQAVDKNGDPLELYYGNDDSDEDNKVPDGTSFGQFIYAFEEYKYKNITPDIADLERDPDTEYARITVIDKRDGTLDYYIEIFEDRYCTKPRTKPGTDEPADKVTFVNQLKRDLSVTKAWADPAISNVTLRLEWAVIDKDATDDTLHWQPVDETTQVPGITGRTEWLHNVDGSKTISKDATGSGLTVTWTNLPAYADITRHDDRTGESGDDNDLNDLWIYYRVVEEPVANVDTRYNETPYAEGDTLDTKVTKDGTEVDKYQIDANGANPFHTGEEKTDLYELITDSNTKITAKEYNALSDAEKASYRKADKTDWVPDNERVKDLYVTNFPKDLPGTVDFGVVKQYIGKVWKDEVFTFRAVPVKASLGDPTYQYRKPKAEGEESDTVISQAQYDALSDDEKAAYTKEVAYTRNGESIPTGMYVNNNDESDVISKAKYDALTDTEKQNYGPQYAPYAMPALTNNTASAAAQGDGATDSVSVNEHAANFKGLTIKMSDLERVTDTKDDDFGKDRGEFIYRITEVLPTTDVETTSEVCGQDADGNNLYYKLATDEHGNRIKYTTEEHYVKIVAVSDGSKIDFTVSYDDRDTGQFVPVFTNYAMMETPVDGTKTWIGGEDTEHVNGTVTFDDDDFTITGATDKLGLKLKRRLAGEDESAAADINGNNKDDAGNDLVIVWVKEDTVEEIVVDKYAYSTDGQTWIPSDSDPNVPIDVIDAEAYAGIDEDDPNYGHYIPYKTHVEETGTREKQEKGDGTYTVKSLKDGKYVDPYLNMVDEEGKEYVYTIVENDVPEHYTASYDGLDVTNTFNVKDSIKVTKTWDDAQNKSGLRPDSVTVHLYKVVPVEGGEEGETETVQVEVAKKEISKQNGDADHEWTTGITWEDLPVYDENGDIIKYVVVEESVSGYTATYKLRDGEYKEEGDKALIIELDDNEDAETIDVKNSLTPATDEVKVEKVWDDNNNAQGKRPASVTLELYKYVYDKATDAYDKKEKKVTERPATAADVAAAKLTDPESTMKVGDDITVPDLVLDGKANTENLVNYEEAAWKGIWKNLPRTENGKTVLYIVKEVTTDGGVYADPGTKGKYTNKPCISGDQVNGYKVTNTYTPDTTTAKVTKKWLDNQNALNSRPSKLTMTLMRKYEGADGQPVHEVANDINGGNIKDKISADDEDPDAETWVYEVKNLPKYTKVVVDGRDVSREYTYYWKETVPAGYTASVAFGSDTSGAAAETGKQTVDNNKTITNTYITGTLTVTKTWDDAKNSDGIRPSAEDFPDKVTLFAGDTRITDFGNAPKVKREITPSSGTTGTGDNQNIYTITYSNLPVFDKAGAPITYSIKEDAIDGYAISVAPQTAALSNTAAQGEPAEYKGNISLTNKHEYETTEIEVTKNWIDQDGFKHEKVDAFRGRLELYADGTKVTDSDLLDNLVMTPTADGDTEPTYTAKWTELPKFKKSGNKLVEIVYTVKEVGTVDGYAAPKYNNKASLGTTKTQKAETDKAYNGGEINNIQLITVDVEKTWDDGSNHDNQRPEEIKIKFFRNGVPLDSAYGGPEVILKKDEAQNKTAGGTFTEADNKYTWTKVLINLPYADDNGVPYNYTAVETEAKKGDHWYSAFVGGETMRQILLNEWNTNKDTLTYKLTNKDDEDKVSFTVDKIWSDSSNIDRLRPETITYKLYQQPQGGDKTLVTEIPTRASIKYTNGTVITMAANGNIVVNTNKMDTTQGTLGRIIISGLPKYASGGKEITYTIVEDAVRGYNLNDAGVAQTVDGSGDQNSGITVTNTHEPVSASVEPQAIKEITGRNFKLSGEEFTFLISPQDGAPRPARDYVTINPGFADGNSKIIALPEFAFDGEDMADKLNAGDTKTFTYTLTEVNGGRTIDDLKYDDAALTLKITVTRKANGELEIKAYDPATTDVNESGVVWGTNNTDADRTFTNEFTTTTNLLVRKIWEDKDADSTVIGSRPTSVTVVVTAEASVETQTLVAADFTKDDEASTTGKVIYNREYTVSKTEDGTLLNDNVWQKTISDIPKLDAEDKEIKYTVTEKPVPNYDAAVVEDDGRWIIKNTYTRSTFTGTKVWDDGNLKHDNASELKDKLELFRTTTPKAEWDDNTKWTKVTDDYHIHWNGDGSSADNKYSQSFKITGLPKEDSEGNAYIYRVVEESVGDDYTTTYTNTGNYAGEDDAIYTGGTVTNKNQDKTTVMAKKEWAGDSEDKNGREAIEFQLVRTVDGATKNIGEPKYATATSETFEPITNAENNDYVVWKDLPTVVEGKKATYDVKEVSVPDGYTSKTEYFDKDADDWTETKPADDKWSGEVRITNTLMTNETQVVVQKVWDDEDDQDGKRPDSVTINIASEPAGDWDGKDIDGNTVGTLTLDDSNNWKSVFRKLPKTNADGKAINYIVSENAVNDYAATVEYQSAADNSWSETKPDDWNNKARITNTHTPEGVEAVTATKVWAGDNDDSYGLRDDVTLHLYGKVDGAIVYDAGSKTIAKGSTDPARWVNLPKYHYSGTAMSWEIVEDSVFGYTPSYRWDRDGTSCTVTNTYTGPNGTIKVTKTWEDDNNNDGKRPDKVYYQLWKKVGDKEKEKVGEPVEAKYDYTWTNLPVTEEVEDGNESVTGYTSETKIRPVTITLVIEGTETTLYAFTVGSDTYYNASEDETGKWYNANGAEIETTDTDSAEYVDVSDAEAVTEEYEETKETTEEVTKYKTVAVLYSVTEVMDKAVTDDNKSLEDLGYSGTVTTTETPGEYKAINVHEPETVSFFVKKVWNDNDNADGARPDHLLIRLKAGDEIVDTARLTESSAGWNGGTHEFKNLPKYKDGDEITYSAVELDKNERTEVAAGSSTTYGYDVSASGTGASDNPYVITNTHVPGKVDMKVTKVWKGDDDDKSTRKDVKLHLIQVYTGTGAHRDMGTTYEKTITANTSAAAGENAGTAEWENLPTQVGGKAVTYTVEEEAVTGYTTTYSDAELINGVWEVTVTNEAKKIKVTYVDPEDTTDPTYNFEKVIDRGQDDNFEPETDPSHDGKTFKGWKRTVDPAGNVTYTAQYDEVKTHTISYIETDPVTGENREVVLGPTTINNGDTEPAQPKNPTPPEGYIFGGWERVVDNDGNISYKSRWVKEPDPGQITVAYTDGTGKTIIADTITRGDNEPAQPADPTRTGYTFGGWKRMIDAVGNVSYEAQWIKNPEAKKYVSYVDPKAADGKMILVDGEFDGQSAADAAAKALKGAPKDPKHKGYDFVGWAVNQDEFGNWIIVAKYNEKTTPQAKPVVSYIDPQSGAPVLVSDLAGSPKDVIPPEDPSHENMQFVGWEETKDVAGNTIFVAKYKCDCRNGSPGTPKDVDKSKVDTGDDAMITVWQLLFLMAISFLILTMMIRKRAMETNVNDSYKSKH